MNQPDLFKVSDEAGFVRGAPAAEAFETTHKNDRNNAHIIRATPKRLEDLPDKFGRWVRFHGEHPEVFAWFREYAQTALLAGGRVGARLIGERIRWYVYFERGETNRDFKVNDHFWPYYARLLMLTDRRFEDFFETRNSDKTDATDQDIVDWYGRAPKPPEPPPAPF